MKRKLVLITGASSGIGRAFARRLAREACDFILVARREDRLRELASEIQKDSMNIEVWPYDLSKQDQIKALVERVKEKEVDLLINNAGFGIGQPFQEIEEPGFTNMITVHCMAAVNLCRAVLPQMIQRKKGEIINVSSVAGLVPVPGSSVYPATKAFLVSFSEAMRRTVNLKNIKIQALCPGYTISEFHNTAYPKIKEKKKKAPLWMTSEEVVESSLKALEKNKSVCIPGWVNRVIVFLVRFPLTAPILWRVIQKNRKDHGAEELKELN